VKINRVIAAAAVAIIASLGVQSPAAAVIGPEGVPITRGATYPNHWHYPSGVRTPISLPYQWLDTGQTWAFGNVRLTLANGELVMRRNGTNAIVWRSRTAGSGATQLLFQRDGNLVLYTAGYRRAVWDTNTNNDCAASGKAPVLSLQGDSNLVIYCTNILILGDGSVIFAGVAAIWDTNTNGV
jgi:hypothetical protein